MIKTFNDSQTNPETTLEKSLPQLLKEKRLEIKMDLEEVASYLRIKPKDLEIIENNDPSAINHLYITGVLRSYAKFLRIEPEVIEEKIKLLSFASNTSNTKHNLVNIGENLDLKPTKDQFINFLMISILLFFISLLLFNIHDDHSDLITIETIVEEMKQIDPYN